MVRVQHAPAVRNLPTYALYGERGGRGAALGTDWLHCESIAERSRHHDWEIRPHRHELLFQILYIRRGFADAAVEGGERRLGGPGALIVPALAPHGFRFSPTVDGLVVTVFERHLAALLARDDALRDRFARLSWVSLGGDRHAAAAVRRAAGALHREFLGTASWRMLAIDTALMQLLVELARVAPAAPGLPAGANARAVEHVRRYRALVEQRFREQPPLGDFAGELGITTTQLNRVCRQVLGRSALEVLHGRLLLEAQRELSYTTLSVKQIGLGIGFADAGYFTRFFQRRTGRTPSGWRSATR